MSFNPVASRGMDVFLSANHLVGSLNNLAFIIPKLLGSISVLNKSREWIPFGEQLLFIFLLLLNES